MRIFKVKRRVKALAVSTSALGVLVSSLGFSGLNASPAMTMDPDLRDQHISQAQRDLQNGNWARSLAKFRWLLLESAPNAQYEIAYQNTIATLTNENPLTFSFNAALLPSSNLSNASSHRIFVTDLGDFLITSSGNKQSGIGLRTGVTATYSQAYAPGRSIFASTSASLDIYRQKELQAAQLGASFGHEWLSAGRQAKLAVFTNHLAYHHIADRDAPDFNATGLSLSTYNRLSHRLSVQTQSHVQKAKYQERDYNDGTNLSAQVTPRYQLDSQNALSLKLGAQRVDIQASHLSYSGRSLGVFWDRVEHSGLSWGIGYEHHWRDFDSRFPSLSFARSDSVSDIVFTASHPGIQLNGMTPRLRCSFRNHSSNVALYDYKSTDCSLSLTYNF